MRIGLYFGSFNPIHIGHLLVAEYMLQQVPFDLVRFVVSPQNPFKEQEDLLPQDLRLEMVECSIADNPAFEVSDIEFSLPKPSYTIQTLEYLQQKEARNQFSIIMGSDNLEKLHSWKDIEKIAASFDFHIYRRRGSEHIVPEIKGKFTFHEAPYLDVSATYIRELMASGKSLRYLVPDAVIPLLKL